MNEINDTKRDSIISWAINPDLLTPNTFFNPISLYRSVDRAVESIMQLIIAMIKITIAIPAKKINLLYISFN